MSKCKQCGSIIGSKAKYCGDSCRMKWNRTPILERLNMNNPNIKPEHSQPEQLTRTHTLGDVKCYGRDAVLCDQFVTRPTPLDKSDIPVPDNRARYQRQDGTVYQFDVSGRSFECKHSCFDADGNEHLAIYEATADVRACYT